MNHTSTKLCNNQTPQILLYGVACTILQHNTTLIVGDIHYLYSLRYRLVLTLISSSYLKNKCKTNTYILYIHYFILILL